MNKLYEVQFAKCGFKPKREKVSYKEKVTKLAIISRIIYEQNAGYLNTLKEGKYTLFPFVFAAFSRICDKGEIIWLGMIIGNKDNYNQILIMLALILKLCQQELKRAPPIESFVRTQRCRMPDKRRAFAVGRFKLVNNLTRMALGEKLDHHKVANVRH